MLVQQEDQEGDAQGDVRGASSDVTSHRIQVCGASCSDELGTRHRAEGVDIFVQGAGNDVYGSHGYMGYTWHIQHAGHPNVDGPRESGELAGQAENPGGRRCAQDHFLAVAPGGPVGHCRLWPSERGFLRPSRGVWSGDGSPCESVGRWWCDRHRSMALVASHHP